MKGRLETEGIRCFIYDEYTIVAHPFRAVTIGGVKLKVLKQEADRAREVITSIDDGYLTDPDGIYELDEVFRGEIDRIERILILKHEIRQDPSLLSDAGIIRCVHELGKEPDVFLKEEKQRAILRDQKFTFNWKRFWYELFDFEGNVFRYFRLRSVEYHLEEELIDNHSNKESSETHITCPICQSENVYRGNAIDHGWSILQILSILIGIALLMEGFFISRVNYHCFKCGNNFRSPR